MKPFSENIAHGNRLNGLVYYRYLRKTIIKPCLFTGNEDFLWEEKYLFRGWPLAEYNDLKKDHPSYKDTFSLIELLPPDDADDDVQAKVVRVSDRKRYIIGLSWLKCSDKKSVNHALVKSYGIWHANR